MLRGYVFASCELHPAKRVLTSRGRRVDIQAKPFDLLVYLIQHRDRVVPASELLGELWPGVVVTPAALSRAVHKARQAVGDEGDEPRVIKTVHGRGFQFVAPLQRSGDERPQAPPSEFIGREAELSRLERAIEHARAGRGGLMLITGEPGIGKTRTLQELLARTADAEVHLVRCPAECAQLAYWPWRQLARRLAEGRTADELVRLAGRAAADFAQIEPDLASRLDLEPLPALSPEGTRARLFDGAVDMLERLAGERLLVLGIDDIHQADLSSLVFLRFLAHRLPERGIVVVVTARDAELAADEERRVLLAEAERQAGGERIELPALSLPDVGRLVEKRTGGPLDAEQLAQLHERSGGNPFFLGELLLMIEQRGVAVLARSGSSGGPALPATVRAAVESHLTRLDPEVRRLLGLASVFGGEFTLADLAVASEVESDAVLGALDAAVALHVLEGLSGTTARFRFVHPLLREALYESLSVAERARHHLRVAQALEESLGSDPLVLAYHWSQAIAVGGARRAVESACRAAEVCTTHLAFESAALHLERALEALSFLPEAPPFQRAKLMVQLGRATLQTLDHRRALKVFRDALALGRKVCDPEECAELGLEVLRSIGPVTHLVSEHHEAIASALESLPADHPSRIEPVLSGIASSVMDGDSDRLAREVVARARASGDAALLASALCTWHWSAWKPETSAERSAAAREIEVLGAAASIEALLEARFLRVLDALERGERPEALEALASLSAAGRDSGHAPSRWRAPLLESVVATAEGRFADAQPLFAEARAKLQRFGGRLVDPYLLSRAHSIWRGFAAGDLSEFEELTRKAAADAPGRALSELPFARELVEHGELAAARERLSACPREELLAAMASSVFLDLIAVIAGRLGDERLCDAAHSRLLPHRGLYLMWPQLCIVLGPAARYLALVSWGLGNLKAAGDYFEEARGQCDALGATSFAIHVACDWASMLAGRGARGDRRTAAGLLADATADALHMRAPGLIRKCEAVRAQI